MGVSLIGKCVKLKSGSPVMIVGGTFIAKTKIEYSVCSWFDAREIKTVNVPTAALVESEPPQPAKPAARKRGG